MTCDCVSCGTCYGIGRLYYECYNEPQDETCPDCHGSGLTEECDECMWQREQEYELLTSEDNGS